MMHILPLLEVQLGDPKSGQNGTDEHSCTIYRNTKTYIWDITDLDNIVLMKTYVHEITVIDHNQYIVEQFTFQSNYMVS